MRFNLYTTILTLGAIPFALGQQVPAGLPACAQTCALSAIGSSGCASTDTRCVCTSSSFITQFDACVAAACSPSDAAVSRQIGGQFCSSAGVPGATSAAASTPAPASSTHPVTSASAPPPAQSSSRPSTPSSQPEIESETETQPPAHPSSTAPPEVEQTSSQFHSSVPATSGAPSSAPPHSIGPVAPIGTASATATVSRPQPLFTGAAVRMQAPGLLMGLGGFLAVVL